MQLNYLQTGRKIKLWQSVNKIKLYHKKKFIFRNLYTVPYVHLAYTNYTGGCQLSCVRAPFL